MLPHIPAFSRAHTIDAGGIMRAAILFCSVLMLCVSVSAQQNMNVDLIGSLYENWDQPQDVEVADGYAFLATNTTGLRIVDISDPFAPQEVSYLGFEVAVVDVEFAYGYAFLAVSDQGFVIADVRHAAHPRVVGRYNTGGLVKAVKVDGRYAYVCNGHDFFIFDISSPAHPDVKSVTDFPIVSSAIAVQDGYLYAGVTDYGFVVYDVSDPVNPVIAGDLLIDGVYLGVQIDGNYAFVSAHSGLEVFDISDPTNPIHVGGEDSVGNIQDLVIIGDYAFIASYNQTVFVYDLSDPTNPQFADVIPTPEHSRGITSDGDYVYVADSRDGLRVLDVSNPLNGFETGYCSPPNLIYHVALQDEHAYLVHNNDGFAIVDISDPATPVETGSLELYQTSYEVAVDGDYAYVTTCFYEDLLVIDVSDPTSPTLLTTVEIDGHWRGIVVDGDYAYIADSVAGLHIVDISNPAEPAEIGVVQADYAYDVSVSGGYAFVADLNTGFHVIDVRDPFNAVEVGNYNFGFAHAVTSVGNYAYVSDYHDGLHIIDVNDPSNPVEIAFFETPNKLDDVQISGDHVFLANWRAGFYVIDVSDPANPEGVGYYDTEWQAGAVAVDGTTAWVMDSFALTALDCSAAINGPLVEITLAADPPPIVLQGESFTFGITLTSHLPNEFPVDVWSKVTLPDGSVSRIIARVNNIPMGPGTVIEVPEVHQAVPVSAPIGWYTYHVRVGNYGSVVDVDAFDFYVRQQVDGASGADGWDVFGFEEAVLANDGEAGELAELPTEFTVSEAYPNPFNAMTRFTVTLPEAAGLTVAVYNVMGQRVVVLADGYMDAGRHQFSVEAYNLSSGVYFLRAEATGQGVQVRKLALIR
jgi:hypothetical protein